MRSTEIRAMGKMMLFHVEKSIPEDLCGLWQQAVAPGKMSSSIEALNLGRELVGV